MENKELLELTLKYCKAQREVFVMDGNKNVVTSYSVDSNKVLKEENKNKYSEYDMQQYAIFCIRCYEQGLPCIIAQDWFKLYKNK